MNRQFSSKLAGVFLGLAVSLVAGVLWGQSQGRVERDIVYSEENGQCIVTALPTQIHAKRNFVIVWRLKNDCNDEIVINVGNFKSDGASKEPIDLSSSAMVASGGSGRIIGVVRSEAEPGTYSYDVFLGDGSAQDPELVIDP